MKTESRRQPLYVPASLEECLGEPSVSIRAKSLLRRVGQALQLYSRRWLYRYRLRRALQEMDSALVEKDIGVPQGYLGIEAYKPFWRE